jgi:hypothetical protein
MQPVFAGAHHERIFKEARSTMSDDATIERDQLAERAFQRDISALRQELAQYQRGLAARVESHLVGFERAS